MDEHKRIGWIKASFFIVADMMGAGMIALANAISKTGIIAGIPLLTFCVFFSGFTGIQLSENWTIMRKKWPEIYASGSCRRPYSEMGFRAFGRKMRIAVDIILAITLFGSVVALMEFIAEHVSFLLADLFHLKISFCILVLITGLVLWPFTMLKSPMHFWQAALLAAVTSATAAGFAVVGTIHDAPVCYKVVEYNVFDWRKMFLGYATIVFACGGHSAFPTIQNDMRRPEHFKRSIVVSYSIILLVYLVVSLVGYTVYGNSLVNTLIPSIQVQWISTTVNVLITAHVLPAILIFFCPLAHQVEEWTNCSHELGFQRFFVRSFVLLLCVFTALSLPNFGVVMDLVGGSTISLITMVLPSIFWLFLSSAASRSNNEENSKMKHVVEETANWQLLLNTASLLFGIIGGAVATSIAVQQLFSAEMPPPCYIQWFRNSPLPSSAAPSQGVHCCGPFRNITVSGVSPGLFCQP